MTPTRIRPAGTADWETLVRFMAALQDHERALDPDLLRPGPDMAESHVAYLMGEVVAHEGVVLIAEDPDSPDPFGFAIAHVEEDPGTLFEAEARRVGRLTDLYVTEAARGRGIGKALIAACEAHFRDQGLTWMTIGVLARNTEAQAAYEAAGYRDWLHLMVRKIG